MAFKEIDLQRNNLTKKLGALLPQIDSRVLWVDYIPGTAIKTGSPLVAIGMRDGKVKYVNISKKSPFDMVNEVLNAMDDYHLDVQFLNDRQFSLIADDIAVLAKDRAKVAGQTLAMLRVYEPSNEDCLKIVLKAQEMGVFPDFFPETKGRLSITPQILEHFLKTNRATFMDTQIISDLVSEQIDRAIDKKQKESELSQKEASESLFANEKESDEELEVV